MSELSVKSNQEANCVAVLATELRRNSFKIIGEDFSKHVIIDDYAPNEELDGYDFGRAHNGKAVLIPRYRYAIEVNQ